MGNVLQAGVGQAPARQAAIYAGLPDDDARPGRSTRCAARGSKAVISGAQAIALGDAEVVVAGGMESMSNVPYYDRAARSGARMGNVELVDGMIHDGLWDPYGQLAHGRCAPRRARTSQGISRARRTSSRVESTRRAIEAQKEGLFEAEIVPVEIEGKKGETTVVAEDEGPKHAQAREDPDPQAGLQEGRHGHRRQRLVHQRRRGGGGPHERGARRAARAGTVLARLIG